MIFFLTELYRGIARINRTNLIRRTNEHDNMINIIRFINYQLNNYIYFIHLFCTSNLQYIHILYDFISNVFSNFEDKKK